MDAKAFAIAAPLALGFILLLLKYSRELHKTPDATIVTDKRQADYWPGKPGGGKFGEEDKKAIFEQYKRRCMYCKASVQIGEPDTRGEMLMAAICDTKEGQFEHIIPAALGGSNAAFNRGLACEQCNIQRGIKPTQQMLDLLRERGEKIYYGKKVEVWN